MAGLRVRLVAPRRRAAQRGFTLTELMVVVVLVGILAVIGIASFRGELAASKSSEAAAVIQAIRGAQEAYRAENQQYLNVSVSGKWYPSNEFTGGRYHWQPSTHDDLARWRRLAAPVTQPVQFRYMVHAGRPGDALPDIHANTPLGTTTEPWFVIEARADADGDGVYCDAAAVSFSSELFIQNEGE